MTPFASFARNTLANINTVFTDIDDTLTIHGRLTAQVLHTLEALRDAGIRVVPVTGRPAGWCHGLPRMWPIAGVVAENGAVAYWLQQNVQRELHHTACATTRAKTQNELLEIQRDLLQQFPNLRAAQDQFQRIADIAFDHNENVPKVPSAQVEALVQALHAHGLATAVSTVHAHGTRSDANKFTMTTAFCEAAWGTPFASIADQCVFIGDSHNDAPMFAGFTHTVGVANVVRTLPTPPRYVTRATEGNGFIELAEALLAARA